MPLQETTYLYRLVLPKNNKNKRLHISNQLSIRDRWKNAHVVWLGVRNCNNNKIIVMYVFLSIDKNTYLIKKQFNNSVKDDKKWNTYIVPIHFNTCAFTTTLNFPLSKLPRENLERNGNSGSEITLINIYVSISKLKEPEKYTEHSLLTAGCNLCRQLPPDCRLLNRVEL